MYELDLIMQYEYFNLSFAGVVISLYQTRYEGFSEKVFLFK